MRIQTKRNLLQAAAAAAIVCAAAVVLVPAASSAQSVGWTPDLASLPALGDLPPAWGGEIISFPSAR